jgi:DNA-binding NtrC family response regulator
MPCQCGGGGWPAEAARALQELGHRTVMTSRVDEALAAANRQPFDLILADTRLPDASGLDLLRSLHELGQDVPVIMMTNYSSVEDAVTSIRGGAIDYLTKPLRFEALRLAVNNAIEVVRLRKENDEYRHRIDERQRLIVGSHPSVRALMDTIAAVAPTRASILLEGESGTGKELLARAIHAQSSRADRPFITVNCAALPEGLVESTLFGHERGAFTGANARFVGAFERAHQGTLLLDEISEMRLDLQSKLLRAIQEQEFERVGGSATVKVDVRIITTTNRNLAAEVAAGRFRADLFYRLSVVPVHTPPLRERLEDLPELVEHFADLSATELGVRVPMISDDTFAALAERPWEGNIRELANAVERAVLLCKGGRLTPDLFPVAPTGSPGARSRAAPVPPVAAAVVTLAGPGRPARVPMSAFGSGQGADLASNAATAVAESYDLTELERDAMRRALGATGGNRTRAARLLGISERTLRKKLNSGFLDR